LVVLFYEIVQPSTWRQIAICQVKSLHGEMLILPPYPDDRYHLPKL
jgi:hypothetical protein